MSEAAELAARGLKRCSRCQRVLEVKHLHGERCKDTLDCAYAQGLRWRARKEAGDTLKKR